MQFNYNHFKVSFHGESCKRRALLRKGCREYITKNKMESFLLSCLLHAAEQQHSCVHGVFILKLHA